MRAIQFFVFFGIVITIHLLVNSYIFFRGLRTFEPGSSERLYFTLIFWFLALSYIAGRVLERIALSWVSDFFTWTGSFWLAAMLYLFLLVALIDLVRLVDHFVPFLQNLLPAIVFHKPKLITYAVLSFVFLVIAAGHLNAIFPRTHEVTIDLEGKKTDLKSLRIAMVSDIHLGTIVSKNRIRRIVNQINETRPDLILLAGDIVDEDLGPVIRENLGETLTKLRAPLGVIGITGNHEFIGGVEPAVKYLTDHGINILRDTAIEISPSVFVAGREDLQGKNFGGKGRKNLEDFNPKHNDYTTLILMDHQPAAIAEAEANQTDLMLSGHTHHGQIWPLNYITSSVYRLSWGYKKFGNLHAYVSSGIGSWGPPVRIGNRPEVVLITLNFKH